MEKQAERDVLFVLFKQRIHISMIFNLILQRYSRDAGMSVNFCDNLTIIKIVADSLVSCMFQLYYCTV